MEITKRNLIWLAETIQEGLKQLRGCRYGEVLNRVSGLSRHIEDLQAIQNKLAACIGRNWHAAAERVTDSLSQSLRELPYVSGEVQRVIDWCKVKPPTVREVYDELLQMQEEFDRINYHDEGDLLCIVTDPIELEGIYLGEFEIQLHVPSLSQMRRGHAIYRIFALDPHPASSNDHITHPHVSDEHLCEGDAGAAIEAALTNGRICDFFILVRAVLTNYNPDSPYVRLDEWDGTPCYDCGCTCSTDEMYFCEHCEHDFCSECYSSCRVCDTSACYGCLTRCPCCDNFACGECMKRCEVCGESVCKSCIYECAECGCEVCDGCLAACNQCSRQLCKACVTDDLCISCAKKTQPQSEVNPNGNQQPVECGAEQSAPQTGQEVGQPPQGRRRTAHRRRQAPAPTAAG